MRIDLLVTFAAALVVAGAPLPARGLDSPLSGDRLAVEAGLTHVEVAMGRGFDSGTFLFGSRLERRALDARIYGGVNFRVVRGSLYELHLQALAGPRIAFRDVTGLGPWAVARARGVWQWEDWRLHSGLYTDSAVELYGLGGWRVRPGGDLGVGYAFDAFDLWLNMDAGYSIGGTGAGGLHLGGSLGVQW